MSFRSIQHHQHTEDEKKTLKNKLKNELFNSTIKFIFIIHERLCYSPNVVIVFAVIAVGVSFLRRYCLMNTHCHNRKTIISVKLATLCSCVHSVCVLLTMWNYTQCFVCLRFPHLVWLLMLLLFFVCFIAYFYHHCYMHPKKYCYWWQQLSVRALQKRLAIIVFVFFNPIILNIDICTPLRKLVGHLNLLSLWQKMSQPEYVKIEKKYMVLWSLGKRTNSNRVKSIRWTQ